MESIFARKQGESDDDDDVGSNGGENQEGSITEGGSSTGVRPGSKTGSRPGSRPGSGPQTRPVSGSQTKPGSEPQSRPGSGLGSRPQARPESGSQTKPGIGLQSRPGSGPQSRPGSGLQSRPGSGPQSSPGSGPQSRPGSGPGSGPQSRPGSGPGSGPQSRPGSGSQSRPGSGPKSRPGSGPQSRPGSGPQNRTGSELQSRPGSGPQSRPGSGPQSRLGSGPQSRPGSRGSQTGGNSPGSKIGSRPGSGILSDGRPGSRIGSRPGSNMSGSGPGSNASRAISAKSRGGSSRHRGISESQEMFLAEIGASKVDDDNAGVDSIGGDVDEDKNVDSPADHIDIEKKTSLLDEPQTDESVRPSMEEKDAVTSQGQNDEEKDEKQSEEDKEDDEKEDNLLPSETTDDNNKKENNLIETNNNDDNATEVLDEKSVSPQPPLEDEVVKDGEKVADDEKLDDVTKKNETDEEVTSQKNDDASMTSSQSDNDESSTTSNVDPPLVDSKQSQVNEVAPQKVADEDDKDSVEDDENKIPDDFYYDSEDYHSTSRVTEDSGIPPHLLEFFHSFGYDCCKRSNLHLLAGPTLLYSAGNLVHLLNLENEEEPKHTFIRSCSGGGIGALTVHGNGKYFAVAEKGIKPHILIYEFPSLKLYRILRGGTERAYSFVDFNPKGDLLASVGSAPDYMLTVWNWKQETIMLRSKAFSQDVYRVKFAPEQEGQLTTCGQTHIRFWKMAWTFTGLKLKGDLGRFGKTALTDIDGFIQLPTGKVLSGSDWGNMLMWDGGLIELEIMRKDGKTCHDGSIHQFILDEGELITIGKDGYVRVWEMEAIDTADTTNEEGTFHINPMNELKVGPDVNLISMIKVTNNDGGDESFESIESIWYAQDSNGAIWKLDLSFSHTTKPPEKLFTCTSGPITQLRTSPNQNLMASTGDMFVHVYNYIDQQLVCSYKSPSIRSKGTCLCWPKEYGDGSGRTIVVGYSDGIVRILQLNVDEEKNLSLNLVQALKPHSREVTSLVFDTSCTHMVTAGADNTCFFFNINMYQDNINIKPIGFVAIEGKITSMEFSPDEWTTKTVLVCLDTGKVVQIAVPNEKNVDTSATFLIDNVDKRTFTFKCVKPVLRRQDEIARKDEIKAERLKERKAELKRLLEAGQEMTDEQQKEFIENDPQALQDDEEKELVYPSTPSAVLQAIYLAPNKFLVSMDDFDAGYLYECQFGDNPSMDSVPKEPIKAYDVKYSKDVPITRIEFSLDGRNCLMGFKNGQIRVYPFKEQILEDNGFKPSMLQDHWDLNMHDNQYGYITSICESYDGCRVFTSAGDGCLFGYHVLDYKEVEESMRKAASLSQLKGDANEDADDIEDPNAYSIQDAKLKSEMDRMIALAEEKKKIERNGLDELRKRFVELVSINQQLPANVRLKHEEFELDPSLREAINHETEEKIARLQLEMQWDKAKLHLAHEKVQKRFKAIVESDLIIVHSFNSDHTLSSYRVTKLSERFLELIWEVEHRIFAKTSRLSSASSSRSSRLNTGNRADDNALLVDQGNETEVPVVVQKKATLLKGRQAELIAKAAKKAEETKKRKLERHREWNALYESRPDDDHEDPSDVAAIKYAKLNMGDFKLKSANDYVVPEHLRMDAEKKRKQMLQLEQQIYHTRMKFNRKLIKLRDRKQEIVTSVNRHIDDVIKLQQQLPSEKCRVIPEIVHMNLQEQPNKIFDFNRETLLNFEEEMRQIELQRQRNNSTDEDAGGAPPVNTKENVDDLKKKQGGGMFAGLKTVTTGSSSSAHQRRADSHEVPVDLPPPRVQPRPTQMEEQMAQLHRIDVSYQRDQLLLRIDHLLKDFDSELKLLRHDKIALDVQLKMANLRQITLLEELYLLQEYELSEDDLITKMTNKQNELQENFNKASDTWYKLDTKKKEISNLQDREKTLYANFIASLDEGNKFADYLTKVFKKKIKRKKPKVLEDGEEDDESDESSDESDWDSDEDDDDSEGGGVVFDDTLCPPGCDEQLFEATLALREKRLDIEEFLTEEKKNAEILKKEHESLTKKIKQIEAHLSVADGELEAFQAEKQQRMNQLDVIVPLHLEQVEVMVNNKLPDDLSEALVFENSALKGLHDRIKGQKLEKKEQRNLFKQARQQQLLLLKNRKVLDNRIHELSTECEHLMTMKFGRIVDLDKIDSVSINRPAEELKEKIRVEGVKIEGEMARKKRYIDKLKDRIIELTRDNTKRLQRLNVLTHDKLQLGKDLDNKQSKVEMGQDQASESVVQEQRRLVQLVQLQSQEIQALKDEIGLLSRKGGHILPPAQPPLQQELDT